MAKTWQEAEIILPVNEFNSAAEASTAHHVARDAARVTAIDWRKRMSDTIAYALLVYTALQIFVTMKLKSNVII